MVRDTPPDAQERYLELLRGLTPAQRLERALELSAFMRQIVWLSAVRYAGGTGPGAVARYLDQMYGDSLPNHLRARLLQE